MATNTYSLDCIITILWLQSGQLYADAATVKMYGPFYVFMFMLRDATEIAVAMTHSDGHSTHTYIMYM